MQIDARGVSCPQPVLMAKNGIEQNPNGIEIIVDSNTAKCNVQRFLKKAGYKVEIQERKDDFILTARK